MRNSYHQGMQEGVQHWFSTAAVKQNRSRVHVYFLQAPQPQDSISDNHPAKASRQPWQGGPGGAHFLEVPVCKQASLNHGENHPNKAVWQEAIRLLGCTGGCAQKTTLGQRTDSLAAHSVCPGQIIPSVVLSGNGLQTPMLERPAQSSQLGGEEQFRNCQCGRALRTHSSGPAQCGTASCCL